MITPLGIFGFEGTVAALLATLTYVNSTKVSNFTNSSSIDFTLPTGWQTGDLAIAVGFWDSDNGPFAMSGWTEIVNNEDGTEYPEGKSFYRILQSGDGTQTITTSGTADTCAGALVVFRPDAPISSVSVGNTAYEDGLYALDQSIAAESPTTVPSGEVRLKGMFLTGRITTVIQNPVPTFVAGGWTWSDGGTTEIDYAYKILEAADTDASEQITVTDTGRQALHLFNLTVT